MRVDIRLLGPLEVRHAGSVVSLSAPKERVLLVLLALNLGRVVAIEELVDVLWGEDPPESAAPSVRVLISRLRKTLAAAGCPDVIHTRSPGYVLADDRVFVDVNRFENLVGQGRSQLAAGAARDASETLEQALGLWHGERLAESATEGLMGEAARLAERRLATLEARIDAQLADGRHAELVAELENLCRRHPLRERFWAQRMLALYRCGRQADALTAYHQLRTTLADDLGLDPSAELRHLERAILGQERTLDAVTAVEMDEHSERSKYSDRSDALVPRQLPIPPRSFIGRAVERRRMDALLPGGGSQSDSGVLCVISGMAGVGKTALALLWARDNSATFPDGQLFLNLRGFDPEGTAMAPAEGLRIVLEAFGLPGERIPGNLGALSGLYRSLLAEKRVLMVLDNARNAAQVRPLLPASPGSAVIVTSRDQLSGLVAAEGAEHISLPLLTPAEARAMLIHRLGLPRTDAEPDAVEHITKACGRLPLALAVAAARAATAPQIPLAAIADELGDESARLDVLAGMDPTTNVRSVLSCSYDALSPLAAELFRRLGQHPRESDISITAAASLSGWRLDQVRPPLSELVQANLVTEQRPARYHLHDVVHSYAREQARRADTEEDRHAAFHRLLDHYGQTVSSAAQLLRPTSEQVKASAPAAGVTTQPPAGRKEAIAWLRAERTGLVALIERAAAAGFDPPAYQLACDFADFLIRQGHRHDLATVSRAALAAARRMSDPSQEAHAERYLATAYIYLDEEGLAETHLRSALELLGQEDNQNGQARCYLDLSWLRDRQRDHRAALQHATQALELYSASGHQSGRANALNDIGWASAQLGDHQAAVTYCEKALATHKVLTDPDGEAHTWDHLGYAYQGLMNYKQAIICYQNAIDLYRDLGFIYDEAGTLDALGDSHQASGAPDLARSAWTRAVNLLEKLDDTATQQILKKLHPMATLNEENQGDRCTSK
jgi:DNA-binding SARP family transcriptional activator